MVNQIKAPDNSPRVKNTMMNICVPHPSMIDSNMPFLGGRKTSP